MAIDSYLTLKTTIQAYVKRTDILDMLDTFIDLAESTMYANPDASLRIRDMEGRATGTLSTANRYEPLPTNYLQMRQVKLNLSHGDYMLDYLAPESLQIYNTTGVPGKYTITDQIEFEFTPDQAYTVEFLYYKTLTPLSVSNLTNAVLTRFPQIYLYGSIFAFYQWAMQEEKAAYYYSAFVQAIQGANHQDKRGRYHSPQVRVVGVTP